tara:strand:- start:4058 stop:4408 length:351 start_codon:yes stop_codon:yes gene_type:complete
MAIYDSTKEICYARGDSAPIAFTLTQAGVAIDITGYTFQFTVNTEKSPIDNSNEQFSLAGVITVALEGKVEFRPTTVNTDLTPAKYYYDVSMVDAGPFKTTIIKSDFVVEQDIDKA